MLISISKTEVTQVT